MADMDKKQNLVATMTLSDDDIVEGPMASRRTALGVIGTLVLGSVVGVITTAPGTARAATDSDPNDSAGRGRTGHSDNDPNDGAGRGHSHGNGHSDNDPNDSAGRGRTGRSDNDPNDSAGHGGH